MILVCVPIHTYLKYREDEYLPQLKEESRSNICSRMHLNVKGLRPSIAASFGDGRTANQLCNFATGYALWKEYGILNFLDKNQFKILRNTFDLPALNEESYSSSYHIWRKGRHLNE